MKPTYHKPDKNQTEIIHALQRAGCTVTDTSSIGGGFPDLAVGRQGVNYLLEVKNPKGRNRVDEKQIDFHITWQGQIVVVRSAEEALQAVGALPYIVLANVCVQTTA